jgi:cellulose synthase/poly-beta-1,6-N-acetylglucosamine synthase-like glycosyltransferase
VFLEKEAPKEHKLVSYPNVTIVIPAYNEEDNIVETMKSAIALDYPKNKLKIIVIDDGSTDRTNERAKGCIAWARKNIASLEIVLLMQKNFGKFAALNNALKHVNSEFFATLDADSSPNKDALKKLINSFTDERIAAVSPILKVYRPKNRIQLVQWFEYSVNHFYKSIISNVNAIHVTPGPLSVYRTKVVKEVGGFRKAHKTEDMEIAMRIQKKQYKIVQCNDAFVYTKAPYTIKELYKQRLRWNYGTFRNLIDYRKMMFDRKYGDFGMFQLPIILISGIMGITILGLITFNAYKSIKPTFKLLSMYNYNLYDYLRYTQFNMIWLDLDARAIVTFLGFFLISMLVLWLSLRLYREKISLRHMSSFFIYLFFYYLFLAIVWLGVLKDLILHRDRKWKT